MTGERETLVLLSQELPNSFPRTTGVVRRGD